MHWINNHLVGCTNCGGEYLHQYETQVYNRRQEDLGGLLTVVRTNAVTTNSIDDMTANPSSRRDGIRIMLSCEDCEGLTELTIVQHKGQTFLSTSKFEGLK